MEQEIINVGSDSIAPSSPYQEVEDIEVETPEESTSTIDEQTQREYRIWKKNAPFLYDYLSTNSLLWPSLNVQFFPDVTDLSQSASAVLLEEEKATNQDEIVAQRLLHGTFTIGQAVDSISILQIPTYKNLNANIKINKLDYNPDKEELELSPTASTKVKVLQKINHLGDVNKVKYMPQNPNIIASANNLGDLVIYERTRHKSFKNTLIDDTDINKVQIRLVNEKIPTNQLTDIFAIDWNKNQEGEILSGDMNGWINLHDLAKYQSETLNESACFKRDNKSPGINDIEWFPTHDALFAAAFEDGSVEIYDKRQQNSTMSNHNISENGNSGS
ncbi:MSI1 [[Candida] subhashii]|uniref:MSI1 n=1 Tax=[Candida] subhashii TaxID=561895 RepID=A0A8J5QRW7_9ASCO|nr:MSI1 [[Candida] subhashii]KAG7666373.1 MSI1 [[Candida] subhashii]